MNSPDKLLIASIFLLLAIGLVVLASASSALAIQKFNDPYWYLKNQILKGVIPGIILFLILARLDWQILKKFALPFFIFSLFLLILVIAVPFLRADWGGASRWLKIGGFSFQPAELVKLAWIIYLSSWLEGRTKLISNWTKGFLPFIFLTALVSLLIILQPNVSTAGIILITSLVIYFIAGGSVLQIALSVGAGLITLFSLIKIAPYRLARIITFFNPSFDPRGISYQMNQILLAIGSGGIFGLGLGGSRQKYFYLPEVLSDSIFAVIAEELGFILTALIIGLYLFIALRGFKIARDSKDKFAMFLATGISFLFIFQALINIGAMLGLVPLTGLPLPLISYGSSSMVVSLASFGILVNLSRETS